MRTGATVLSFRPNEIRLDEIRDQIGDADELDVMLLDATGAQKHVTVALTLKWGGRGWRKELECQGCAGPARNLHIAFGAALCRRCWPVPRPHELHKNSPRWRSEGALLDAILRSLRKAKPGKAARRTRQRFAARLLSNTLANAGRVIEQATRLAQAVDNLPR
jgi:hypothetical protein